MTWKEKTVVRILLIIAGMMADAELKKELETLATHISVNATEIR